jgi:hypothetical protein
MKQQPLFHEDFDSALTTCVGALGGAKVVGVMLRPEYEKEPDKAARWLLACLNPSRDEKLSWDQTFKVMLEAKAVGCHAGMNYIAQHCGYADPQPIEPEDERAELQRLVLSAVSNFESLVTRLEAVSNKPARKR